MILRPFLLDVNEANAYVVGCPATREALLVDAGDFDFRIVDFIAENRLRLSAIFITHDHYDHTGGLPGYAGEYSARVLSAMGKVGGKFSIPAQHGDNICVGDIVGRVCKTSGHTPDSISLVLPGMVFTGDALFAGSIGGTYSQEQAREEKENVREHILSLPDDYVIYPGHGPASLVWVERSANPFFV